MKYLNYLMIILSITISCANVKQKEKEVDQSAHVHTVKKDSLTFTTGIGAIFQDQNGHYWFGSSEGVSRFDGNTFTYFTMSEGLSDNHIISIQEDADGVIWICTQKGVSSFDGNRITNYSKNIAEDTPHEWAKTPDDLWFSAGIKEGVYRYADQRLRYLAFPDPNVVNPNNVYSVTGLSKGQNDMLWIGTYAGVFGYNGNDFTVINDETLGLNIIAEPLHIRSILEDSKGRLWIGNNGIGVLLKQGDSIINFSEKNNLIHPTSTRRGDISQPGTLEHIFTITEDRQGNIWFGDRDTGVWKYDGNTMKNFTTKDGLTNDFALAIFEDMNGEMWFGMADGKVYKFNGETFEEPF